MTVDMKYVEVHLKCSCFMLAKVGGFYLINQFSFNHSYFSNFLTTTTETSQNSSKWSHCSTDHKKRIYFCNSCLHLQLELDFKKSLIGDIFATVKTKISLLLSVTQLKQLKQQQTKWPKVLWKSQVWHGLFKLNILK